MSARLVAIAISAVADATWMPLTSHWEIAQTDGVWGAHAELAAEGSVSAVMKLTRFASEVGSELVDVSDHLMAVDFTRNEVPFRVWWLRPVLRWIVPPTCATCPTKLGDPGVAFVRLGQGDREAPVICVPCRDLMQAQWVAQASVPLSVKTAVTRLAQYAERAGRWSPATYNDGDGEALHQIALTLAARGADLEVERGKLVRWHEEDARQLKKWGHRVAELEARAASELTVFRASYPESGITLGTYRTRPAAMGHVHHVLAREENTTALAIELRVIWRADDPEADEPVWECWLHDKDGADDKPTGYVVGPVTVAEAYAPDGDE